MFTIFIKFLNTLNVNSKHCMQLICNKYRLQEREAHTHQTINYMDNKKIKRMKSNEKSTLGIKYIPEKKKNVISNASKCVSLNNAKKGH